jgi:4-amino-4-deoxy-L-arabinose transferase-like glycosyltransferase
LGSIIALCVVLGVVLRALLLHWSVDAEPLLDEAFYLSLAIHLQQFGVYVGKWAPGYPYVLAFALQLLGPAALLGIKLVQLALSGVIGASTIALAARAFDRRAALVAGLIWSAYLPLAGYAHELRPEVWFLALLLPALLLLTDSLREAGSAASQLRIMASGTLVGVAMLFKESALFLTPLLVVPFFVLMPVRLATRYAALFGLAAVLVVLPWTLRNWEVHERFLPVAHTMGDNVYWGLNGVYVNYDYPGDLLSRAYGQDDWVYRAFMVPQRDSWQRSRLPNYVDRSRENTARGLRYAAARPGYFLAARVKKVADALTPMSFFTRDLLLDRYGGPLDTPIGRRMALVAALASTCALLPLGVAGLIYRRWRGGVAWALWVPAAYFAGTCLLVSMSRFRVPFEPMLIVSAAAVLARPSVLREAGWGRHLGFGLALLVLAGLWLLNGSGTAMLARLVWESSRG